MMANHKKLGRFLPIVLLIFWANYLACSANFNLFVSRTEVKRLLGLTAELYYVREGVVNEYAMGWTVKVPANIHAIHFNWESLTKKPVLYNLATWTNTSSAVGEATNLLLLEPSLNISSSGVIPKKSSSFQLNIPCTGLASGEIDVILNLNVTSSRADKKPTVLYFNRKKICLKGVAAESFLPHKGGVKDPPQPPQGPAAEEDEEQVWLPLFTYVISVVTSLVLIVGVIVAVACWRCKILAKRKKCTFPTNRSPLFIASTQIEGKLSENKPQFAHLEASYSGPSPVGTYTAPSAVTGNSYASVYKFPFQSTDLTVGGTNSRQCKCTSSTCSGLYESSCYSSSNCNSGTNNSRSENETSSGKEREEDLSQREPKIHLKHMECKFDRSCDRLTVGPCSDVSTLRERFKMLQMDRERVRLTEVVQEGRRGRVYKGWLQREHPELDQQVWIKTLKEGSQPEEVEVFCHEASLLLGLRHHNLMNIVGMSFTPCSPPFLIFPDPMGINLKIYLQTSRPLKVLDLVEIYLEASHGLSFMHSKNIAHGDIAARNCIISDNLHLRLTDSALAADLFPEDYEGQIQKPVRWMAPEVLAGKEDKSTLTDMWSLGVLLWELTTPGEHPYYGMNHEHIYGSLLTGLRLRQVFSCPDELYQLMNACWNLLPQRRPTAQKSTEFLSSFKQSLQSFV